MITMLDVWEVLQGLSDDTDIADGSWSVSGATRCLESLSVTWPEERVEWFNIAVLDLDDILALSNVDFDMRECDVCDDLYHVADQDDDFLEKYGCSPRGGRSFSSASGEEIYICSDCVLTDRVVGLFLN